VPKTEKNYKTKRIFIYLLLKENVTNNVINVSLFAHDKITLKTQTVNKRRQDARHPLFNAAKFGWRPLLHSRVGPRNHVLDGGSDPREKGKGAAVVQFSDSAVNFANKSSAVAEMDDRLATIGMGRKVGRGCCGRLGPHWVPI